MAGSSTPKRGRGKATRNKPATQPKKPPTTKTRSTKAVDTLNNKDTSDELDESEDEPAKSTKEKKGKDKLQIPVFTVECVSRSVLTETR